MTLSDLQPRNGHYSALLYWMRQFWGSITSTCLKLDPRCCCIKVNVVFIKYPDECCPAMCTRHCHCCDVVSVAITHGQFTALLDMVSSVTWSVLRWLDASGGRAAVSCTNSSNIVTSKRSLSPWSSQAAFLW